MFQGPVCVQAMLDAGRKGGGEGGQGRVLLDFRQTCCPGHVLCVVLPHNGRYPEYKFRGFLALAVLCSRLLLGENPIGVAWRGWNWRMVGGAIGGEGGTGEG